MLVLRRLTTVLKLDLLCPRGKKAIYSSILIRKGRTVVLIYNLNLFLLELKYKASFL